MPLFNLESLGIVVHVKYCGSCHNSVWHEPQYLTTQAQRVAYLAMNKKISENLVTLVTLIWFLPSVYYHIFKRAITCKSLVTLTTFIWFLPSVCHHVTFKMAIHCKRLVTLAALIWPLPSVCPHMIFKSITYQEILVTLAALICFPPECVLRWVLR